MDEPFGALDPIIRAKAQEDLLAIQKRFGTTIILVTHDMEEAIHLGDKIAVMDAGKRRAIRHARRNPGEAGDAPSSKTLVGDRRAAVPAALARAGRRGGRTGHGGGRGDSRPPPASATRWRNCCGPAQPRCRSKARTARRSGRVTVDGLVERAARPA